jgi:CO/xanthine dehydrogenase Mo-binding subunit
LKARWAEKGEVEESQQYSHPSHLHWDGETLQGDAYPAFGWGAAAVEVEVDPVTYEVVTKGAWAVFDIGTAIDQKIVEGQIEGGMVQGLGYANIERMEVKDGRFMQSTMADYCIPTSLDYPSIGSDLVDNPFEYGPYGAKGAGELVFDGAAPAFLDAVQMAVDRDLYKIPISPEYVMEVLDDAEN